MAMVKARKREQQGASEQKATPALSEATPAVAATPSQV